jgi:hypothetical protein
MLHRLQGGLVSQRTEKIIDLGDPGRGRRVFKTDRSSLYYASQATAEGLTSFSD